MVNGRLKRILLRRPEVDDVDVELAERIRDRLRRLPVDTGEVPSVAPAPTSTIESPAEDSPPAHSTDPGSTMTTVVDGRGETHEMPESAVDVMALLEHSSWGQAEPELEPESEQLALAELEPEPVVVAEPEPALEPEPVAIAEPEPESQPVLVRMPAVNVAAAPVATRPDRAVTTSAVPAPYCPYCALLLSPPPETSRRCPRCRERIVVKHVDGRAVYLTTAALAVFDLEHRRTVDAIRWAKERTRWLKAAATVDAPAEKVARLGSAPLSADVVAASQALYLTTVDRSFRVAKRERRWQDASMIMRDHAGLLYRFAGSPLPPPDDIEAIYREGVKAMLRGLDAIARVAELGAVRCCPTCEADDGRVFKIAEELRVPRLPHAGCPKGLCSCDWFLAAGDHTEVRRHLRRRPRTETAVRQPS